jgi:hypothetical protein
MWDNFLVLCEEYCFLRSEISGSHGAVYEHGYVRVCCGVLCDRGLLTFQGPIVEAVSNSDTLVDFCQTTERNNIEESHLNTSFIVLRGKEFEKTTLKSRRSTQAHNVPIVV